MPDDRSFADNVWRNITRTGGVFSQHTSMNAGGENTGISRPLDEFKNFLERNEASLSDGTRLHEVTEALERQLSEPQPDQKAVRALLVDLFREAEGNSMVFEAVASLAASITQVL